MIVHKCDRCGFIYEHYGNSSAGECEPNGFKFIFRSNTRSGEMDGKDYELCPGCLTQLKDWATMGSGKDNGGAATQPGSGGRREVE